MQQIERYGVIALVFLLVTIVAISFWGDSKSPGFWSRITGKKPTEVAKLETPTPPPGPVIDGPPLTRELPSPTPQPEPVPAPDPIVGQVGANPAPTPGRELEPRPLETWQAPRPEPAPAPREKLPPTRPALPAANEYVVQRGDSLAKIARNVLGAESRWTEIAQLNPRVDPRALVVGEKLALPSAAAAPKPSTPELAKKPVAKAAPELKSAPASRSVTVQKGDTLRSIARRELGDERRWNEIVGLNPGLDPQKLATGTRLRLPAKSGELLAAAAPASSVPADRPRVR